jgi:hypothetical protein
MEWIGGGDWIGLEIVGVAVQMHRFRLGGTCTGGKDDRSAWWMWMPAGDQGVRRNEMASSWLFTR